MFPTGEANIVLWTQTLIDGMRRVPPSALRPGAVWTHLPVTGSAVLPDGAGPGLRALGLAPGARRLGQLSMADGSTLFTAQVIQPEGASFPMLVFEHGAVPPPDRPLEVIDVSLDDLTAAPVICFTAGTPIDTDRGARPVESVRPGDRLWTRDCGYRDVLWVGRRRLIGATLAARPQLRPVRLPDSDVMVSPDHRVLIEGRCEHLRPAADLPGAARCLPVAGVSYVHLMLADHQIVSTAGLHSETFHPAAMPLSGLAPSQRAALFSVAPALAEDPASFGPTARPVPA